MEYSAYDSKRKPRKRKKFNVDWTNRKQISTISIIKFIVSGLNHATKKTNLSK